MHTHSTPLADIGFNLCRCCRDFFILAEDNAALAVQAFDIEPSTCLKVSAKTGLGLGTVLPAVIEHVPPPSGNPAGPLRMLLFDAFHDEYR